jgi:CxxC motif-containing protein
MKKIKREKKKFQIKNIECGGCANNCKIVCFLEGDKLIRIQGNKCPIGVERAKEKIEKEKLIYIEKI